MKRSPILYSLLTFLCSIQISFAQNAGGGSVGNGGKEIGAYLTDAIVEIYELLDQKCEKMQPTSGIAKTICDSRPKLFEVMGKTKIGADYIVYGKSDFKPRDAVNDLLANGDFFVTYSIRNLAKADAAGRRRVLVHEFMTLAGKESSDSYSFSVLTLRFLADEPALQNVLSKLPEFERQERHFFARDLSVRTLQGVHPVLLRDAEEFLRFCISKGYDGVRSTGIRDITWKKWKEHAGSGTQNPVILDSSGEVSSITEGLPNDTRVLYSVTCY